MADPRRAPFRLLAVLTVLAIAGLAIAWGGRLYDKVLDLRYGGTLPAPSGPPPRDAVQARAQDLDYLARLPDVDRSFTPEAAARFRRRIARLRSEVATLDDARFFVAVASAVALSGNAHTNVDAASWRAKLASSPVRFAWFPEGLFVVRAMAGHEDLLGARVLAIDGRAPETLEREAMPYFAGTAAYVLASSPLLLESPPALNALHPDASAARLDLRFDAGGDYPDAYPALRSLARRLAPDGRLTILTDETTFSAAIVAAVLARHFAGPRAVVVGSGPGDRLEFWAEGSPARLPNSGIEIGVSTGYHDWSHGCRELRCWWPNFYYDVAGGDLAPPVPVRWRFAGYRRGVDTVLQRAIE